MGIDFESYINHAFMCDCGREHECRGGGVDIAQGALQRLPEHVHALHSEHPHVIADLNTWEAAGKQVVEILQAAGIESSSHVLPYEMPVPDEQVIGELFAHVPPSCDLVISVGTGVLNDLGKLLSYRCKVDYLIVATAPSMDGFLAIGAPMILNHVKTTVDCHGPMAVIGDLDILASSPMYLINAGIGDILGKHSALLEWKLSQMINGEYYCERTATLTRECLDNVTAQCPRIPSRNLDAVASVMDTLVLVGVAAAWVETSRPGAGSEHHMSHVWEMNTQMSGREAIPHGTKVGIAEPGMLYLHHLLAEESIDFDAARARTFDKQAWLERTRRVYLDAAPAIIAIEEKSGKNDLAKRNARLDYMEAHWDEICALMRALPQPEEITKLLEDLGAPARPSEADISDELVRDAVLVGKDVRDRWTLLQMLWDLGLDETYAQRLVEFYHA